MSMSFESQVRSPSEITATPDQSIMYLTAKPYFSKTVPEGFKTSHETGEEGSEVTYNFQTFS